MCACETSTQSTGAATSATGAARRRWATRGRRIGSVMSRIEPISMTRVECPTYVSRTGPPHEPCSASSSFSRSLSERFSFDFLRDSRTMSFVADQPKVDAMATRPNVMFHAIRIICWASEYAVTVLAGATSRSANDAIACCVPTPPGVTANVDETEFAAMIRKTFRTVTGIPNAYMKFAFTPMRAVYEATCSASTRVTYRRGRRRIAAPAFASSHTCLYRFHRNRATIKSRRPASTRNTTLGPLSDVAWLADLSADPGRDRNRYT